MNKVLALTIVFLTVPAVVTAQSNDAAAERARLANQRIQAEAERQAQEAERQAQEEERQLAEAARLEAEQARLAARQATAAAEQEKQQLAQAQPMTGSAEDAAVVAPSPNRAADMTKALEQLRTLGELKDAGYVTEDEFERIKKKIIGATD